MPAPCSGYVPADTAQVLGVRSYSNHPVHVGARAAERIRAGRNRVKAPRCPRTPLPPRTSISACRLVLAAFALVTLTGYRTGESVVRPRPPLVRCARLRYLASAFLGGITMPRSEGLTTTVSTKGQVVLPKAGGGALRNIRRGKPRSTGRTPRCSTPA